MLRKSVPLALALAAAPVLAAPTPASPQDATLEEVLSRHYEAIGGLEAWRGLGSMRASGTVELPQGLRAPFEMVVARPDRARMEFSFQGMTGIQAYDGETAWMYMPFMGQTEPRPMPAHLARDLVEQADLDGPLVGWEEEGHELRLVGRTEVSGAEAYRIDVTLAGGEVRRYFLDAEDYLPIRITGTRTVQGARMEMETSLGDYREVGGLLFPHSIRAGTASGQQTITIREMELDVDPDPDLFTMPGRGAGSGGS